MQYSPGFKIDLLGWGQKNAVHDLKKTFLKQCMMILVLCLLWVLTRKASQFYSEGINSFTLSLN